MKKIAVYPGSFDPITNGHIDVLKRILKVFDEVIVLIANNPNKKNLFTIEERLSLAKESLKNFKNVKVDSYKGLTVNYAKKVKAVALVRGLRSSNDFTYEFSLNVANNIIDNSIETIYVMANKETFFISSSSLLELHNNKVDIKKFVPLCVYNKLKNIK